VTQLNRIANQSVSALKERMTIPDVQVEWRELGESFLLSLLSIVLYVSVIFAEFSFIPIMIIVIKRGWKEALVLLIIGTVLLVYIMVNRIEKFPLDIEILLFSPAHYSFSFIEKVTGLNGGRFLDFFFIYGCFGIFLGYFVSRNYTLNYVIFFSLIVYIGVYIFPLILSGLIGGFKHLLEGYAQFVQMKTTNYVDMYLNQIRQFSPLFIERGIDYGIVAKKVQVAAEIYQNNIVFGIAPRGGYLIKQIIVIFLAIVLVKLYLKRKLSKAALVFSIKNYRIADGWVWGLILSWGFVFLNLFLKNNALGIIGWNAAVIFSFLFFFRGLALIKILADKIRIPQIFQYAILLFFLFYSFIFFVTVVTGVGVADIWLKVRETVENRKKRSDT
jgi:hypothetical protein